MLCDYMTFKEFCREYAHVVSAGGLRWILFKSKENGADRFVRKIGPKKLLISPTLFFKWIEDNNKTSE
jgi:hypothetical protein